MRWHRGSWTVSRCAPRAAPDAWDADAGQERAAPARIAGWMPAGWSFRWIEVCTLASGVPLRVAVHEIEGATDGPCLGVSALIHGDEVTGPEVVRRLRDFVDPATLRGR